MNAQLQHTALDELQRKVGKAKSLLILDHPFFGTMYQAPYHLH